MIRKRLFIFLFLLYSIAGVSQKDFYMDAVSEKMSKRINALMKKHHVTGISLAVVDNQEVIWAKGFGYANKEKELLANSKTNYRICSLTKLFTASAILQLHEQEKIHIDSSIMHYLPSFCINSHDGSDIEEITPRHLLAHHSGLPSDLYKGFFSSKPVDYKNILDNLKDEYMAYPPGSCFNYSNIGYDLLGWLIEKQTGVSFKEHIEDHVFLHLNMKHSFVETGTDTSNYAKGYNWNTYFDEGKLRDLPAGGVISNVEDMANFIKMLFANGAFGKANFLDSLSVANMQKPQYTNKQTSSKIGLPWFFSFPANSAFRETKMLYYGGSSSVYNSRIVLLPDYKIGVVVLSNSSQSRRILDKICKELLELAIKEKYNVAINNSEKIKIDRKADINLSEFEGEYLAGNKIKRVEAEKNKLRLEFKGTKATLLPNNMGTLTAKIRLLGFIPILLRHIEFVASKLDTTAVLSTGDWVIGSKISKVEIPAIWKGRIGKYDLNNQGDDCLYYTNSELKMENGYLVFTAASLPEFFVLKPVDDNIAIKMGAGRGLSETVYITSDDKGREILNISGYQLLKQDLHRD